MMRTLLGLVLVTLVAGCAGSQKLAKLAPGERPRGFLVDRVENGGTPRNYSVFVPYGPPPADGYPVILALHGLGEGGSDGRKPTAVGIGPHIARQPEGFDFLVVFPQIGGMVNWDSDDAARVAIEALDDALRTYGGDPSRVVATGYSNGGKGVWAVAGRYPGRFAGLVPMCAYAAPQYVNQLVSIPTWVWHNTMDWAVRNGNSDKMVRLLKEAGADVKYTEPGSASHDVWVKAFRDEELYTWMRQRRR